MYQKRELPIGKKYNMLTVLADVPCDEKGRRYVYCECECGSKKVLRWDQVKSGDTKSCGCLASVRSAGQIEKMIITRRRKREKVIAKEYIGKKFGRLTILSIFRHPTRPHTHFLTRCDCGKTPAPVSIRDLRRGHVLSCGCSKRKYATTFTSGIDGETMLVSCGKRSRYYARLLDESGARPNVHVYEARKAFRLLGKDWSDDFAVHHIDNEKSNNAPNNLAVMESNSAHQRHHAEMQRAMFLFLKTHGLLETFFEEYPNCKLTTLEDLLRASSAGVH